MNKNEVLEILEGLRHRLIRIKNITNDDISDEFKLVSLIIELSD
jgi:hypothetical protein